MFQSLPLRAAALLAGCFLIPRLVADPMPVITSDIDGGIATIQVNLTVDETAGGHLLSDAKKNSEANKGVTYPDYYTYEYLLVGEQHGPTLLNPFAWDASSSNNYIERVTEKTKAGVKTVTATGALRIVSTRYSNATLLEDLARSGVLTGAPITDERSVADAIRGYRLISVSFNVNRLGGAEAVGYHNEAGGFTTTVAGGHYFFAEKGEGDPNPIFLGCEFRGHDYAGSAVLAAHFHTSAESAKYVDTFTENGAGGYTHAFVSEAYKGVSIGSIQITRPAPIPGARYTMEASGAFDWSKEYDGAKGIYLFGDVRAKNLAGRAALQVSVEGSDNEYHAAIVTGSVSLSAAVFRPSLQKYLKRLPALTSSPE